MTNVLITGQLALQNTSNQIKLGTGSAVTTLSVTTPAASRTITIPDAGANSNLVLDTGGALNISNTATTGYALTATGTNAASWQVAPTTAVTPASYGYTYTLNSVASTTLTTASTYFQHFGGTGGSNDVIMPTEQNGLTFCFIHDGAGTLTIKDSTSATITTKTGSSSITLVYSSSNGWTTVQTA